LILTECPVQIHHRDAEKRPAEHLEAEAREATLKRYRILSENYRRRPEKYRRQQRELFLGVNQ